MINITLFNSHSKNRTIDIPVDGFYTSHITNKLYLQYQNDDDARNIEEILKKNDFKTSHSDKMIMVHNLEDIDVIYK